MSEPQTRSVVAGALAFLGAVAGILLWILMLSGPWKLATGLLDAREHLDRAEKSISAGALKEAQYDTLAAIAATRRARQGLGAGGPLVDLAASVPSIGNALDEVGHIVRAAELSADAAEGTLNVAQNALRGPGQIITKDPDQPNGGSRIRIERIREIGTTIIDIREAIEGVARQLGSVDLANLPSRLRPEIKDGIEQAQRAQKQLADAQAGLSFLPRFLGADERRTYLLAMQNSAEQRGTGGAILQYRLLSIFRGAPKLLENAEGTVYQIDTNRRPIDITLPRDAWYVQGIRDAQRFGNANWSPDWPLSAKLTLDYARATPGTKFPNIDGVILVDPVVMQEMLPGTGPFNTTRGTRVSQRRIIHFLLNQAYASFPGPKYRRARLEAVVNGFYERMLNPDHPGELVRGMGEAIAEKHIQIWLEDPRDQSFVRRMNWDGAIEPAKRRDYLNVVEQNVGGNKIDYFDDSEISVQIDPLNPRDVRVQTKVTIANEVFLPQPRWSMGNSGPLHRPMINVYVPRDAQLLRAKTYGSRLDEAAEGLAAWEGGINPPEHFERGKKVWSAVLEIEPGKRGAVGFDYSVPGVIRTRGNRSVYRLALQHQPKVRPDDLEIRFTLPEGAAKVRADGWRRTGSAGAAKLVWDGALNEDMTLEVSWES